MYQTSKQLFKFFLSGIVAVSSDLVVYYGLSHLFGEFEIRVTDNFHLDDIDLFKGIGFIVGTFVTYNLNKYWTWRLTDRKKGRVRKFIILYGLTFFFNVAMNKFALNLLPDNEFAITIKHYSGQIEELFAMKIDKILAFGIATFLSSLLSFTGQKLWVFKEDEGEIEMEDENPEQD